MSNWPHGGARRSVVTAPPDIIERNNDHVLALWSRTVIVVWSHETTVSAVRRLGEHLLARATAVGQPVGLFMVVEESAPLPSSDARSMSAVVLRKAKLAFSAVTFEGSGFRAAMVRAVVTGIGMLAKQPYPHQAFARLEDAAAWVAERTMKGQGDPISQDDLIRAVRIVRG
jgi:hypothetical protein